MNRSQDWRVASEHSEGMAHLTLRPSKVGRRDVLRASGRGNMGCDDQPIFKCAWMSIGKLAGHLSGIGELSTAMRRPGGSYGVLAASNGARYDGTNSTDGLLNLNGLRERALAEWPGVGNTGGNINRHIFPRQSGALRGFIREKVLISVGVTRSHNAGCGCRGHKPGHGAGERPNAPWRPGPQPR